MLVWIPEGKEHIPIRINQGGYNKETAYRETGIDKG